MSILSERLNTGSRFSAKLPKKIPWFIYIWDSPYILMSRNVPESITSQKTINRTNQSIPGAGTSIPKFGNIDAEKISFSIKLASFNNELGVTDQVRFFDLLRTPDSPTTDVVSRPFTANPQVLYWYGNGKLPMLYYVAKCDYRLSKWNIYGMPQVVDVDFEFILDEESKVYKMEVAARKLLAATAGAESVASQLSPSKFKNPYKAPSASINLIRRFL